MCFTELVLCALTSGRLHFECQRRLKQRRALWYKHNVSQLEKDGLDDLELKDWFTDAGCAGHDAGGALRWGLFRWKGETTLKDVYRG